uniref:Gluconokinase n=1 Tax=Macrostomum lignano TaxID=282301 RepID=A0A1I8FJY3_9PLAT
MSVISPLLATGCQRASKSRIMHALVTAWHTPWISIGLPMRRYTLVIYTSKLAVESLAEDDRRARPRVPAAQARLRESAQRKPDPVPIEADLLVVCSEKGPAVLGADHSRAVVHSDDSSSSSSGRRGCLKAAKRRPATSAIDARRSDMLGSRLVVCLLSQAFLATPGLRRGFQRGDVPGAHAWIDCRPKPTDQPAAATKLQAAIGEIGGRLERLALGDSKQAASRLWQPAAVPGGGSVATTSSSLLLPLGQTRPGRAWGPPALLRCSPWPRWLDATVSREQCVKRVAGAPLPRPRQLELLRGPLPVADICHAALVCHPDEREPLVEAVRLQAKEFATDLQVRCLDSEQAHDDMEAMEQASVVALFLSRAVLPDLRARLTSACCSLALCRAGRRKRSRTPKELSRLSRAGLARQQFYKLTPRRVRLCCLLRPAIVERLLGLRGKPGHHSAVRCWSRCCQSSLLCLPAGSQTNQSLGSRSWSQFKLPQIFQSATEFLLDLTAAESKSFFSSFI